jgi:hypothetical protein
MRMLDGQSFDLRGLSLPKGFALDLGPGSAAVIDLPVSLGLSLLGAGGGDAELYARGD